MVRLPTSRSALRLRVRVRIGVRAGVQGLRQSSVHLDRVRPVVVYQRIRIAATVRPVSGSYM